jgi:hypothetical protein
MIYIHNSFKIENYSIILENKNFKENITMNHLYLFLTLIFISYLQNFIHVSWSFIKILKYGNKLIHYNHVCSFYQFLTSFLKQNINWIIFKTWCSSKFCLYIFVKLFILKIYKVFVIENFSCKIVICKY